jgi:hypothetical protein
MTWQRETSGIYESDCGKLEIVRSELCPYRWSLWRRVPAPYDWKMCGDDNGFTTLREAKEAFERIFQIAWRK